MNRVVEEASRLVQNRWQIASGAMDTRIRKWKYLEQMYDIGTRRNKEPMTDERGERINSDSGIANLSASVLYNAVETILPRLLPLFDSEGWFSFVPRGTTKLESAMYAQLLIETQFDECHAYNVWYAAVKQAVKLGSAVIKTRWKRETGKRYDRRMTRAGKEIFVPTTGMVFNGPWIELVPYWNFYPDPRGRLSLDDCEYVIEETLMSLAQIKEYAESGYFDMTKYRELKTALNREASRSDPSTSNDDFANEDACGEIDTNRKNIVVYVYQEDKRYIYAAKTNHLDSQFYPVVLNSKNQENPYDHQAKQYVVLNVNYDERSVWSKGVIEPLRDQQAVETSLMNMTLDSLVKILRPDTLYSDDLGVDFKDLMNYVPGQWRKVDAINGNIRDKIYERRPEVNIIPALANIKMMLHSDDQEISGVTDLMGGRSSIGSNKTARGVALLTQSAESRIITPKTSLSLGATRILELIHSMNQQYGSPEEDIYGSYNIKVFEQATIDKAQRLQVLQMMLPIIAQMGGNVREVVKRILRLGGETAIDSIMPADGSMPENQKSQLAQMMLMQGQGGQQGVQ